MISIQMTVAEAIGVAAACNNELHDRIVAAFEMALGVNQRRSVTITGGMSTDNRIKCIKSIRAATGWGLKESKDWTDVIVGYHDACGRWVHGGSDNTITLKSPQTAEELLRELTDHGCKGFLS